MLLSMAGILFSATMPTGFTAVRQAGETKKAVTLAQRKIEQVESLGYESLAYTNLRTAGVVDDSSSVSPYVFTLADSLSNVLPSADGTLDVSDEGGGVKRVTVVIKWKSDGVTRNVTLRTLIADKRPFGG
jgi:hypothetical protein